MPLRRVTCRSLAQKRAGIAPFYLIQITPLYLREEHALPGNFERCFDLTPEFLQTFQA